MRKVHFYLIGLVSLLLLTVSCVSYSTGPVPRVNGKVIDMKALGSPADHTLIYGYISFGMRDDSVPFASMIFAQLNTAQEPMYIYPGVSEKFFYFQPVPTGTFFSLVHFTLKGYQKTYRMAPEVNWENGVRILAEKPGLQYTGHFLETNIDEKDESDDAEWGFIKHDNMNEAFALKTLLAKFKGTEWEAVIAAKIAEGKK